MAKLKMSGIVTAMSGKLGGSILVNTANGTVLKQNSYSQQHASPLQTLQRTKIGLFTQLWRDVTIYRKGLWTTATAQYPYINNINEEAFYTNSQLFNLLNSNLMLVNQAALLTPPIFVAASTPTFYVSWISNNNMSFYAENLNINDTIVFYATPPAPLNTSFKNTNQRYIGQIENNATTLDTNVTTMYTNTFGVGTPSNEIYIGMKAVNRITGNTSGILDFKRIQSGH